jgi:hypothetical protein
MLGSFQLIRDDGEPRRHPDRGSLYWRGVFARAEAEIVPGSRMSRVYAAPAASSTGRSRMSSCRKGGPCRKSVSRSRTSRRAGLVSLISCRFSAGGPHHSAVITRIARTGINALIELAGGKQPRGRPPSGRSETARKCRTPSGGPMRS